MKKRAAKTKSSAKAKRAAKPSTARAAAKTTQAPRTSGAASYTPPPLKGDGWPPFRYPVR
jgi:hypothetical protein